MISKDNIKFERITVKHGLSQSEVTCILQDRQGFMWFGTQDGLNRYDGYNFIVFKKNPSDKFSISNNYVTCMLEDNEGFIWAGTSTGGLNRFDTSTQRFISYQHDQDDPFSISFNQIRCIREDSYGNLWIGTSTGGLNKLLRRENKFIRYYKNTDDEFSIGCNSIRCILEDSKKNLWFGTWGEGLKRYEHESGRFIDYKNMNSDLPNANRINSIYEDSKGEIWLATNLGLQKLNKENKSYTEYQKNENPDSCISDNLVSVIYEFEPGIMLIGTREGGLNIFYTEKQKFVHLKYSDLNEKSLSNNSIMDIIECRSNVIWIATSGGGVNKMRRYQKNITHYQNIAGEKNCINGNKVFAIYEDSEGIIWTGTTDTGLNSIDRKKNLITQYGNSISGIKLSDYKINQIKEDSKGRLIVMTNLGGINIIDLHKGKNIIYKFDAHDTNSLSHNFATSFLEMGNDIFLVGTYGGGLNKIDMKRNIIVKYRYNPSDLNGIGSDRIRTMLKTSDGEIWIGLDGGLNRFDYEKNKFTRFVHDGKDEKSLSGNHVLVVFEDSKKRLWVGTAGDGLNYFDRQKNKFTKYGLNEGLPNETVNCILEDDGGSLWISTNNGISRFNPETLAFRNYDEMDGFQGNEFNHGAACKLRSGELAFGGMEGLNIFNPSDLKDSEYKPEIVLTDFRIFNKSVSISDIGSQLTKAINKTDEISLTYRESVISFEFSALDFNNPEKNEYSYLMEGFDKKWIYSGSRRFVTYTNLNPGSYVLRVRGTNNDGKWSDNECLLRINISPPFWKTMWFKGLSVMAVAGLTGNIYRSKLNKIQKEKEAQVLFTKKLIEAQETDRKRIASELHDSLGHELLITKNKLLLTEKNPDDKKYIMNEIKDATEIISNAIQNVREISYNLHPYQIERLGFTKAIASIVERVTKNTKIKIYSGLDDTDKFLNPETEINLYRIIQECMNNIVKHSGASEVLLNLNKGENNVSIVITDNGKGFDMEKVMKNTHERGFGLKGMKERVKLFGGSIDIKSSSGEGTEIKIIAPLDNRN